MWNKLKKILFILITVNIIYLPVSAQVLDLSSSKNSFSVNKCTGEIYKPSKLIIGSKTGFVVKAEPESFVSLVLSSENSGSPPLYGQNLRIGTVINTVEGVVGEKGVTELIVELPEEEELIGKIIYFEAVVWKREDFKDLTKAKIIGTNGRETNVNAVVIAGKPESGSGLKFGPTMPGVGDVSRTMEALNKQESLDIENNDLYYYNKPLIIRNLRAPELQEQKEQENKEE